MNKHHPYRNIIERKLEQLPTADANLLWNDMHSILDKKMPQKKERRRFIVWFLSSNSFFLLSLGLFITGSTLLFLSKKESSAGAIKKSHDFQHPNKIIEDGLAKVSQEPEENITTPKELIQKTGNNITAPGASASTVDYVITNNFIKKKAIEQSKKYTTTDQFNPPTEAVAKKSTNFGIAPVYLESIHHFLIASDHDQEKKSLSPQVELVTNKVWPNASNIKNAGNNKNERGLYAGIISGADLSSVHFQSAKTGATMGFILGYAFNQKWSVESGLYWDIKRVYDNGSYFNPPGYTPTNGITITAVNGKYRLYELPVNIKYTIISGRHNLFATAGLSSYLMRSENYDYEYTQNSQPGGHNYLSYTNETKDWFSVVNFSVGYTHKLGGNGSIRVEPYLKLPIKNIGTGNMPVMSTGLNIGFTKPLKR